MGEDFPGGGETGALVRAFDWGSTPLGPREHWPVSLKTLVRTLLHARQPMVIWWGPALTQIYNDGMIASMGDTHPRGMGRPAREEWPEQWRRIGDELARVLDHGDSVSKVDAHVPVARNGGVEDAWWTYNFTPIFDDAGARAGILTIVTETTHNVRGRRETERATLEAEVAREELRAAFMQAPTPIAILLGPDLVFALANESYERLVYKPVIGQALREAFTVEALDHYLRSIEDVYRTGTPALLAEAPLVLPDANGVSELRYIDVGYYPYRNADRETVGVIAFISEVTARVAQRELLEREQELRLAAESEARSRDEFLAMLSHELRNPIAPIMTAAELMRRSGDHHPKERQIIERQVGQLAQLVDDLLDAARVTRGIVALRRRAVDLGEIVANAIEQANPLILARQHELWRFTPPEPIVVDADGIRLTQVLSNLLANAAKYTPPHGRIEISALRERGEAVIRVTDDGPGIEPELLPRIFEMFVQGARDRGRPEGGLGLGLPLAKHLVAMHGGTVSARNLEPCGTELTVRIPALDANVEVAPSIAPPLVSARSRSILVVDDNADAANMLASFLRIGRHRVRVAADAREALALLAEAPAELALLDIGLPDMDGFALARAIRALPGGQTMQLVAVTGYGLARDREQTAAAGFDAHLTKPVPLSELERFIADR